MRVIPSRGDGEGPRDRSADQLAPHNAASTNNLALAQANGWVIARSLAVSAARDDTHVPMIITSPRPIASLILLPNLPAF
jgi:hypothetical protein